MPIVLQDGIVLLVEDHSRLASGKPLAGFLRPQATSSEGYPDQLERTVQRGNRFKRAFFRTMAYWSCVVVEKSFIAK